MAAGKDVEVVRPGLAWEREVGAHSVDVGGQLEAACEGLFTFAGQQGCLANFTQKHTD